MAARGAWNARDFIRALNDDRSFKEARALIELLADRGKSTTSTAFEAFGRRSVRDARPAGAYLLHLQAGARIVLLDAMVKKRDDIPHEILARVRALNNQVR